MFSDMVLLRQRTTAELGPSGTPKTEGRMSGGGGQGDQE